MKSAKWTGTSKGRQTVQTMEIQTKCKGRQTGETVYRTCTVDKQEKHSVYSTCTEQ